ncbi:MAG: NAD-glutamate dehydrogenase domain-containing protein, partial [Pseudomonadota bacterium]
RLVGAFNHLHIFLDPNPDPSKSYAERARLFNLPRSTWEDYNSELLSKGGGIFSRSAKSIVLSPEVRDVLAIEDKALTPNELINAMLKAPVDLLWNGGIGTYVKSQGESHADVRDRANDAVRVDGAELRCKVVGEGGNLGLTQLGRIEFAQNGGILYTDAIDNSAGVDCSDHEVNIKILVNAAVNKGKLSGKRRDRLLADMTDEVADLVLRDNYEQTQAISVESARGGAKLEEHARFMESHEAQERLDREIEFLPDVEEIADRMAQRQGLSRPELSVLVSYSKMTMYDEVVQSSLPEDPYFSKHLTDYFPKPLRQRFAAEIHEHRLRREIIATIVTNDFVNSVGPTFAHRIKEQLWSDAPEVCAAYAGGTAVFDLHSLRREIESLDNEVSAATQFEMLAMVSGLTERCIHWLIRNRMSTSGVDTIIDYFNDGITQLTEVLPRALAPINLQTLDARVHHFSSAGVPDNLAQKIGMLVPYSSAFDIVNIARQGNEDVEAVAAVFFEIGSHLELAWLRERIAELEVSNHWHQLAKFGLRTDLHARQSELAAQVLDITKKRNSPATRVNYWKQQQSDSLGKYARLIGEMKASKATDFAMLSLTVNEVYNLQR